MVLEWSAEHAAEITTELIDLEILPTATNVERKCAQSGVRASADAHNTHEANDIVANSRKDPLEAWRRLQKRYDPTAGGRKRNFQRTITSPGRRSLLELQSWIERWDSHVSRYEKS